MFVYPTGQKNNPFCVPPSYNFWAPWIGSKTHRANVVLNTEFEKVHKAKTADRTEITVSEDRLKDELSKQKVKTFLLILYYLSVLAYYFTHVLYVIGGSDKKTVSGVWFRCQRLSHRSTPATFGGDEVKGGL